MSKFFYKIEYGAHKDTMLGYRLKVLQGVLHTGPESRAMKYDLHLTVEGIDDRGISFTNNTGASIDLDRVESLRNKLYSSEPFCILVEEYNQVHFARYNGYIIMVAYEFLSRVDEESLIDALDEFIESRRERCT